MNNNTYHLQSSGYCIVAAHESFDFSIISIHVDKTSVAFSNTLLQKLVLCEVAFNRLVKILAVIFFLFAWKSQEESNLEE